MKGLSDLRKQSFYITTPIYHPSGKLHIGSALQLLHVMFCSQARLMGYELFYLTGLDEHGQKILRPGAEEADISPQACRWYGSWGQELWRSWIFLMINLSGRPMTTMKRLGKPMSWTTLSPRWYLLGEYSLVFRFWRGILYWKPAGWSLPWWKWSKSAE